jgi:hypothetical protein
MTGPSRGLTCSTCCFPFVAFALREVQHKSDVPALGLRSGALGLLVRSPRRFCLRPGALHHADFWPLANSVGGNHFIHLRCAHQPPGHCLEHLQVRRVIRLSCGRLTLLSLSACRSYRDKSGQMRSAFEAGKPLYPLIGLFIISNSWAYFSPNDILNYDPRVFFMITGTIFSNFSVSLALLYPRAAGAFH